MAATIMLFGSTVLACDYLEATGGGEQLVIDEPAHKMWTYTCRTCTSTEYRYDCKGPFPHWTVKVSDLVAPPDGWDTATFGECDDVATFTCLDE